MTLEARHRTPERFAVEAIVRLAGSAEFTLPTAINKPIGYEADARRRFEQAAMADYGRAKTLVDDLAARIADGKAPADITKAIADAEVSDRHSAIAIRVYQQAVDIADANVIAAFRSHGDAVHAAIVHAFEDVVDKVRALAPSLKAVDITVRDRLLNASDDVRQAFLGLEALAERHAALRKAERHLRTLTGTPSYDETEACWYFHDPRPVWGPQWRARRRAKQQPYPDSAAGFLLWAVTESPIPMWLPSATEQDAAGRTLIEAERVPQPSVAAATI